MGSTTSPARCAATLVLAGVMMRRVRELPVLVVATLSFNTIGVTWNRLPEGSRIGVVVDLQLGDLIGNN